MSSAKAATHVRILEAALALLEASRGEPVRMTDIARRAGITRQAVYLHFGTRAELLIAATIHLDELNGSEERLAASRSATSGVERLDAYVTAWTQYIPDVYVVARAVLSMKDTDEAAAAAWELRMQDMWEGCEAAIQALACDGTLTAEHTASEATDILWTMLSIRNWEHLTIDRGWSQEKYVDTLRSLARRLFVAS